MPSWLSFNPDSREFIGNPTHENIGNYEIEVVATDNLGAFVPDNFTLTVLTSVGIGDLETDGYYIYPNPTQDLLNVYSKQNIVDISITDVLGKQIFLESDKNNLQNIEIDLSNYSNGIYMMTIKFNDNSTVTKKIIKE